MAGQLARRRLCETTGMRRGTDVDVLALSMTNHTLLRICPNVLRIVAAVFLLSLATLASAQSPLSSEPYVSGLTQPVGFVQDPALPHVQYVVQQDGLIRVIENGVLRTQPFLDLSGSVLNSGEQGLLGLALAPDYPVSGRFYVYFSRLADGAHIVARFTRSAADPFQANAASRFDLLWPAMPDIHSNCTQPEQRAICQPFSNHNGGKLTFGPDGICTSGSATAGRATIPSIKPSGRARCSASWCVSTSTSLFRTLVATPFRPTTRSPVPIPSERSTRSGRWQ